MKLDLNIMDMWTFLRQYIELYCMFNAVQHYSSVFNFVSYVQFHFLDFTFILNGLLKNVKCRFHCIWVRN